MLQRVENAWVTGMHRAGEREPGTVFKIRKVRS